MSATSEYGNHSPRRRFAPAPPVLRGGALLLALLLVAPAPEAAAREHARRGGTPPADAHEEPVGTLKLVISLREQTLRVFRGTAMILTSRVSTGRKGYDTPSGIFSILQKHRWHRSNIYSRAPMPYMQRLTWSGIALHAGYVPDYPASHGCIRLPETFATELFGVTEKGAHVIVAEDEAEPFSLAHPNLVQPLPAPALLPAAAPADGAIALADTEADFEARRAVARRSGAPLRILITRRNGRERLMDVQNALRSLGHEPGTVDGYMGPKTARAVRAFQQARALPASGIVDTQTAAALFRAVGRNGPPTGHLYVRQGFRQIFDAPVELRAPEQELGTHFFIVDDIATDGAGAEWIGLTVRPSPTRDAAGALAAVVLPGWIRARLGRLLTAGSSLIVSDEGLGKETGKGTDFIVLLQ